MLPIAYLSVLLLCCAYTVRFGGRTGRYCVVLVVFTTVLTMAAARIDASFTRFMPALMLADLSLLAGLLTIAFTSDRFWPLWMAAFQLNCVTAHLVAVVSPRIVGPVYYAMETFWGIPILLAMAIGSALDQRHDRLVDMQPAEGRPT